MELEGSGFLPITKKGAMMKFVAWKLSGLGGHKMKRSAGLLYKTISTKNSINRSLSENCLVNIPKMDLLRRPPHAGVDEEICGTISTCYLG